MTIKFILLAVFGIAMAHLEGVVVFYLRGALGLVNSYSNQQVLERFSKRYLTIEKTREVSTIIMLFVLSYLVGTTLLDIIMVFLWTFAFWDLFYYLSLYVLLKWPPNLKTMDVLFLIPRPWLAPVWFPIGISSLTIILIALFYLLP
jgi:hypothetical protein